MAISEDLFLAILAMDSYNRGYNAGLNLAVFGVSGTQIGNAEIRTDELPLGYEAASFFAQAYSWNGRTVISYRGTRKGFTGIEDKTEREDLIAYLERESASELCLWDRLTPR